MGDKASGKLPVCFWKTAIESSLIYHDLPMLNMVMFHSFFGKRLPGRVNSAKMVARSPGLGAQKERGTDVFPRGEVMLLQLG